LKADVTRRLTLLFGCFAVTLSLTSCSSNPKSTNQQEVKTFEHKFAYFAKNVCGHLAGASNAFSFVEYLAYHNWQTEDETNLARSIAQGAYEEGRNNCSDPAIVDRIFVDGLLLDHDLGGTVNGWP
jgi:hypothetical protein